MKSFLTFLVLFIVAGSIFAQQNCPPNMTNYWKLDETTGAPYVDSFGADDAQSVNPPVVTDGICGNAQRFDGSNQEVYVPVSETFNWGVDDNFTIEYWLKVENDTPGNKVAIGRDDNLSSLHWWSGIFSGGDPSFILVDTDGTVGVLRDSTSIIDGTWHHIVAIRNAAVDSIYLWVDGELKAAKQIFYSSGFESTTKNLDIGYLNLTNRFYFNGVIDEVALYNDALTKNEIETHYTNGLAGICYCDDNGGSNPDYVLLAEEQIKLYRQRSSVGDVHSNSSIVYKPNCFWWQGYQTGNLSALGDIYIKKGNTIDGNATAGGNIELYGNAEVTGSISKNTSVDYVEIPTADFTAGGNNVYVSFRQSKELEPGSYGHVRVRWLGKLKLTAGDYYFESLRTDFYSKILADITDGPVNVYVVGKMNLGPKSTVKPIPAGIDASESLTFTTLHANKVYLGGFGQYYGTYNAPNGYVKVGYYTRLKGSIAARKITVLRGTQFVPHGYDQPFAKQPDMDTIEDENESNMIVEEYALNQNYPNPFNPSTTLSFTLPEAGNVNLTIYDLLGQKVATLIDDNMSAGYHSAVFNAKNLPSGIYIYRLISENFTETKKMQLLK
ncbi:MAG: T9SS type A sorting domain-containing protein [Ignavibacteriae bacterium]|nr:T9SS C-terminal target domain-containing protein [Ignavibacteriota bacterium]NOG99470.1 T9SS type A sorting domain-containing protein [Ignavibacteriota bacterium]